MIVIKSLINITDAEKLISCAASHHLLFCISIFGIEMRRSTFRGRKQRKYYGRAEPCFLETQHKSGWKKATVEYQTEAKVRALKQGLRELRGRARRRGMEACGTQKEAGVAHQLGARLSAPPKMIRRRSGCSLGPSNEGQPRLVALSCSNLRWFIERSKTS